MFLKRLTVLKGSETIRDITFKKGLNLVVDETSRKNTDSGNDVGKTTFLRVVDYCLGSDGKSIYTDQESKRPNQKILDFLHSNVTFKLSLGVEQKDHLIERKFGDYSKIDGQELSGRDFLNVIGRNFLHLNGAKPSSREVFKKFLRIESNQMNNTLRFLHPNTTDEVYESVYLYLFGFTDFNLLERKISSIRKKKKIETQLTAMKSHSPDALRQMLIVINDDISNLTEKVNNFEIQDSLSDEVQRLDDIQASIRKVSLELSKAKVKVRLHSETLENLEKTSANIDIGKIEALYKQANAFVPNLQKSFKDLVSYHNSMIDNKISFVKKSLRAASKNAEEQEEKLGSLTSQESIILSELAKTGALSDLQKIQNELNELYEQKGQKEGVLETIDDLNLEKEEIEKSLSEITEKLEEFSEELDKRLGQFNIIFSDYSNSLYGEKYVLSADQVKKKHTDVYQFKIDNVKGNVGAGKKKAQVSAFDLAYLKFLENMRAQSVRFTLHDRLEDVHSNQLRTLFNISEDIDGQYIVAVLKDKVRELDTNFLDRCTILSLSQTDRFFKLD